MKKIMVGGAPCLGRVLALVAASALALVACGGGESVGVTSTSRVSGGGQTTFTSQTSVTTQVATTSPELGSTRWNVSDYSLPTGAITNVWPDTEVSLIFGEDGGVSGSVGCNSYSGNFVVEGEYDEFEEGVRDENDGQSIHIVVLSVTEKACSPEHVMEQEGEILSLLQGVDRWFISRGELILRSSEGLFLKANSDG